MTAREQSKALGVPYRTLMRYRGRPDWPRDGDIDRQREYVAAVRGQGQSHPRQRPANVQPDLPGGSLTEQKMREEIHKLRYQNQRARDQVIAEASEELRGKARRYMAHLQEWLTAWAGKRKLGNAAREEINRGIDECMERLRQES